MNSASTTCRKQRRHPKGILFWSLLLVLPNFLFAQWTFLGPQWLSSEAVKSHSLTMSHEWQAHYAFCSDSGFVEVRKYDSGNWVLLPNGDLPLNGIYEVEHRFDHQGIGCLLIGPTLAFYTLDTNNGWDQQFGLPNVQNAEHLQLKSAANGKIWACWVQVTALDTNTHIWQRSAASGWQPAGALDGMAIDLELDEQGIPVLLFAGQAHLQRLNGSNWDTLPSFPRNNGAYVNLATEADGAGLGVLALFRDLNGHLSMDRLRNGQWQQIGNPAFAFADETDLMMDFSGVPHVACVQNSIDGLPEVWKLDDNTWELVGNNAAYNNTVSKPILAFDTSTVFLSFWDDEKDFRNSVMVFGGPLVAPSFAENESLEFFPNPVSNVLNLRLEHPSSSISLTIVDGFGRPVLKQRHLSGMEWAFDLSFLRAGTYFLIVENHIGIRKMGKFIKNGN